MGSNKLDSNATNLRSIWAVNVAAFSICELLYNKQGMLFVKQFATNVRHLVG